MSFSDQDKEQTKDIAQDILDDLVIYFAAVMGECEAAGIDPKVAAAGITIAINTMATFEAALMMAGQVASAYKLKKGRSPNRFDLYGASSEDNKTTGLGPAHLNLADPE